MTGIRTSSTAILTFSRLSLAFIIAFAFLGGHSSLAQDRCASADLLKKENSSRKAYMPGGLEFEKRLRQYKEALRTADGDTSIFTIPVVVHIIHNGESVGNGANVSDDIVKSQIRILNEDYRRKPGTNGFNTDSSGTDVGIEFMLATCDTNGNYTTGITRTEGRPGTWALGDDALLKSQSLWPIDRYLNIWVCDVETPILGYSTFPEVTGIPMGASPGNYIDGVVIDYKAFGAHNFGGSYNLGRTATHEIGHYLGLIHVWGDQGGCSGDDFCDDTPIQEGQINFCPVAVTPCPGQNPPMIANYLQYTSDRCMNVFTKDQAYRMRFVMRNSSRHILKDSMQTCATPVLPKEKALVSAHYSSARSSFIVEDQSVDTTLPAHLKLYTIDGRLVMEGVGMERTLELGPISVAKGVYILSFERGNTSKVIKVVPFQFSE